jgi:hypothetical protein
MIIQPLLLTRPAMSVLGVRSSPARAGQVSGVVRAHCHRQLHARNKELGPTASCEGRS